MKDNKPGSIDIEAEIIKVLRKAWGKPCNPKQIVNKLNIPYKLSTNDLAPILEKMVKEDKIQTTDKFRYYLPIDRRTFTGKVFMRRNGEALVECEDFPENIIVESGMQKQALHLDTVRVSLLAKKGATYKGEIVEILERFKMQYSGIIKVHKDYAFLIPDDRKMNKDIFIPRITDEIRNSTGKKVLVEITDWPADAKSPFGKVIKVLGEPGDNNTEMHAIVSEFGFETEFPEKVLAEAAALSDTLSKEDLKHREDFRNTLTVTIDPETAKDFDDAISFKTLPNGNYELGVHIADVSHYVKPGTALDDEAQKRATSVYLVDRTIPMLPKRISEDLCSLVPNQDRPAFSVIFEMDKQAKVISSRFAKTVIHSDKRMAYEDAQKAIENDSEPLSKEIKELNRLAMILRENRFKEGAVNFESTEYRFKLDETGKPIELTIKERKEANKMIEEFMLLANRTVAKHGFKTYEKYNKTYPFVFRFHDEPNPLKIEEFKKFAFRWGYQVKTDSVTQVRKSINELTAKLEGKAEGDIIMQMAIRSMAKATYTPYFPKHFGLAFDFYTHFTSPIRRYPDLLVHRILFEQVSGQQNGKKEYGEVKHLEMLCKQSSSMEQKASEAERASIKYKQAEFMKQHIGETFDAVITGITEFGIFAEIIQTRCEGLIRLSSMKDDMYDLNENKLSLKGRYHSREYRMGDHIKATVKEANPLARTIDLEMFQEEGVSQNRAPRPGNRSQHKHKRRKR